MKTDTKVLLAALMLFTVGASAKWLNQPVDPLPVVVEKLKIMPSVEKAVEFNKDKHCLAVLVYGEARGESFYGKAGVAWVVLNRYDMGPYSTICEVIFKDSQFEAMQKPRFAKAAISGNPPEKYNKKAWEESVKVASLAYDSIIPDPTKGSRFFVNPKKLKVQPKWLDSFNKKVVIENHHFYG